MRYKVRDGLAFCITGGKTIFLDVAADRYFGLRPEWDAAFQRYLGDKENGDGIEPLLRGHILVSAGEGEPFSQQALIEPAGREFLAECSQVLNSRTLLFILAQFKAMLSLRFLRFDSIISGIADRSHRLGAASGDYSDLAQWGPIVGAFAASAPLRPRNNHCLTNSIAFMDMALSARLPAKLVLGVSASPFSAHCWVQTGDTVLNDRLENISAFEPILAI
ncbi:MULTISPECIES: lasso peptide biosynthesis B2 protein [Sphingomonadaceae]|uniref:Microcin J25-processing protein McjB C-terminal domain-containing protein n=1 Tax=Sphingomonas bisphenolicum TaxID=296544 RepID=A0ABN5WEF0_9SPHN|nr:MULTISPECIES: lasso peptide biosynthesis B2 protein [Sphingomonadaceae]BBF70632.1 hypothetical protein SBA_ch1_28320 [Sphingomonas bisphenolicum]